MSADVKGEIPEPLCIGTTNEGKNYCPGFVFIKRSLPPSEYFTGSQGVYVPRLAKERLINEAAALEHIRQNTDIPVPKVWGHFESNQAYYLMTETIAGVGPSNFWEHQKAPLFEELATHQSKLKTLRFNKLGGPTGLVIPPYRVMQQTETDRWRLRDTDHSEYVFCHNDLCQNNTMVDPRTLKIAGFYLERFERVDDGEELLAFLESRVEGLRGRGHGQVVS
ncbi:kinase-like domain protein [Parachaetomium inaequale]|uniref:Kinase-like domain protein n=1 Tax=Parachaetomium inaequale TaxID=2588326 RepID=A0AAN6PKM4_9PEZI|nr:kinase-like domain protein [Parachaetomium inaequale]